MTRYLDSLVAHDPKAAPLAESVRFTEDAKELPVGDGLWKTATKLRPFRTDFLDPMTGTAAVHAVVEEAGAPVLLAARLRVANRRITEIETIVVRNRQEGALFEPDALAQTSPAMVEAPLAAQRMPRDALGRDRAALSRGTQGRQLRDVQRAVRAERVSARERRAHGRPRLHVPAAELREHARAAPSDAREHRGARRRRRRSRTARCSCGWTSARLLAGAAGSRAAVARDVRGVQDSRRPSARRRGHLRRHAGRHGFGLALIEARNAGLYDAAWDGRWRSWRSALVLRARRSSPCSPRRSGARAGGSRDRRQRAARRGLPRGARGGPAGAARQRARCGRPRARARRGARRRARARRLSGGELDGLFMCADRATMRRFAARSSARYCEDVNDPKLVELGVHQSGDDTWIVMAGRTECRLRRCRIRPPSRSACSSSSTPRARQPRRCGRDAVRRGAAARVVDDVDGRRVAAFARHGRTRLARP